ncbi:MAG: restriction endonuclease subunit S [Gemmataceae bacterium]|nr:restriction endonuclease subunit S [Gemmataceae bacterium]
MRTSKPIKDFVLGIYDGPHATPKESSEGPIFLGIKNITEDGRLDFSEIRHVAEDDFPRWTRRVTPQPGDIVFSYEATLHRYALIPEGFRGCLGRRIALIRPNPDRVDSRYLLYYCLSRQWRKVVEGFVKTGATVDRIPLESFPSFPVTLPDVATQRKVAEVLSAYDDLIENNQRRLALLEEAARLLYREWFVRLRFPGYEHTRIVNGTPENWQKKTAFEVMQILSGGTPRTTVREYWDGEIPFYTPKDAIDCTYVLDTTKHLTQQGLSNCNSKLYPKDTIFITARGTVGNLNLAQRPMAMNQSCYALVGREGVPQLFLFCAMRAAVQQLQQHAVGAVFDAIVIDTFKRLPFMIPDRKLIDLFEESAQPLFRQVEVLLLQNQNLQSARDILLPRLMRGEITV